MTSRIPWATVQCSRTRWIFKSKCLTVVGEKPDAKTLHPEIVEEFRCWRSARNQQLIAGSGTGDVEQMALRVVHVFQISIVGDHFDPFLQGNDFVVAGHDNDRTEL